MPKTTDPLAELRRLLAGHDWHYRQIDRTDDPAYQRGQAREGAIHAAVLELPP